jgi:hypothetical protein
MVRSFIITLCLPPLMVLPTHPSPGLTSALQVPVRIKVILQACAGKQGLPYFVRRWQFKIERRDGVCEERGCQEWDLHCSMHSAVTLHSSSLMASDYSTCTVSDPAKDRRLQPYCGKCSSKGTSRGAFLCRKFEVRGSRFEVPTVLTMRSSLFTAFKL